LVRIEYIIIIKIARGPGGRGGVVYIDIIGVDRCIIICINEVLNIRIRCICTGPAYVQLGIGDIDVAAIIAAGAVDGQYVVEIEISGSHTRRWKCEVEPRPVHIDGGVIGGGVPDSVTIIIVSSFGGRQVDERIIDPCLAIGEGIYNIGIGIIDA
jgi:hypothetical protein